MALTAVEHAQQNIGGGRWPATNVVAGDTTKPIELSPSRTCRGSACIASGSKEIAVSQLFLLPQKAPVNLLSRTQLFLLCIVRCFCPATFASVVCAFCCPAVFAAPQQFERIIEARLGLSG